MHANVLLVVTICTLVFLESFTHVFNDILSCMAVEWVAWNDDLSLWARVRPWVLSGFRKTYIKKTGITFLTGIPYKTDVSLVFNKGVGGNMAGG